MTAEEWRLIAGRFWRFVTKRGPDECWPWAGSKFQRSSNGHGRFTIYLGGVAVATIATNRLAYQFHHGVVLSDALLVRHECDNPPCCNPAHLLPGTDIQNAEDRRKRGRVTEYRRKMTHEDAVEARALKATGRWTTTELAARFNVSHYHMSQVLKGKIHKDKDK